MWSTADGAGTSPADCCAGGFDEKALGEKSSAHGDPPDGFVTGAAAWEAEVEASRRGETERRTDARGLARLAAVRPKRSFRDAIAAGEPSIEKIGFFFFFETKDREDW